MKNPKILTSIGFLIVIFLSSCLKDPGTPVVTANKSTVGVNEEVTLTLSGVENYTCLSWARTSGVDYTLISGGTKDDLTMKVKFGSTGTCTIQAAVKNCKDGCIGECRNEYAETTITIQ